MLIKVSHAACEIRHYSVFQLESSRGCTASRCEVTHKDAPKLVQHPVRRRIEALHVLLRPPSHVRESLLGSTTIRLRCSMCQAMTSGNEAAMVGEGYRGDKVVKLKNPACESHIGLQIWNVDLPHLAGVRECPVWTLALAL